MCAWYFIWQVNSNTISWKRCGTGIALCFRSWRSCQTRNQHPGVLIHFDCKSLQITANDPFWLCHVLKLRECICVNHLEVCVDHSSPLCGNDVRVPAWISVHQHHHVAFVAPIYIFWVCQTTTNCQPTSLNLSIRKLFLSFLNTQTSTAPT